jgi:urease accessory protein
LRLAWQLGGNHVPAEIGSDVLYVPATSANAELVRGQGCASTPVSRAFKPEREAHDHSQCGHDHGHHHHH